MNIKTTNMIASAAFAICSLGMFGAALSSGKKILKSVDIEAGTLSIKGSGEFACAVQSWSQPNYSTSGVIGVVAKGGIAERASKAIAAQFPRQLENAPTIGMWGTNLNLPRILSSLIDDLNAAYTTPVYGDGISDPNDLNVSDVVVLLVCASGNTLVCGTGHNEAGEANIVPQITTRERSLDASKGQDVWFNLDKDSSDDTLTAICWENKS